MFLKRVKVDDFRVLKNVDLTFEPDFEPSIFPLGSLNGGGKSTLLQLIFTLLHCSFDETKHEYLINMLSPVVENKSGDFSLAQFEILHNTKNFSLNFMIVDHEYDGLNLDFFSNRVAQLKEYWNSLKFFSTKLKNSTSLYIGDELYFAFNELIKQIGKNALLDTYEVDRLLAYQRPTTPECFSIASKLLTQIDRKFPKLADLSDESIECISNELHNRDVIYLTHLSSKKVLLCKTTENFNFLVDMSFQIYLAAPSTQVFLFFSTFAKTTLFKAGEHPYSKYVSGIKQELSTLFTYDFAPVETIIDAFKRARDKDFAIALKSGSYGDNFQKLKTDLQSFLLNKSITASDDLSRIIFKLQDNDEELRPEDLSHGELKKLGIYVWLKYQEIENALVLMDEIEIGLHPDWQYEIANELQKWSHGNQFILATHSYELCQALTPSHVKELSPKLIK
jgi:predicted ATPase